MFDAARQRAPVGMRWEDSVLGMLDDLEMQAAGLHLAERAAEVDELGIAQYAEVELTGRLHASIDRPVRVALTDGIELHGRLAGAGSDWMLLEAEHVGAWFVQLSATAVIRGLAGGTVPEGARPLSARLSLRSVLRGLAADGQACALHLHGGGTLHGPLTRVGADFVELRPSDVAEAVTVPLAAVTVVRGLDAGRS